MADEAMKALLTILRHREIVGESLHNIAHEIDLRAHQHDRSKLELDEFAGFEQINVVAREHEYGSPEYKAALKQFNVEGGCIALHNERNTHHPEHHADPTKMGWLDIVEMVCDWEAASRTYQQTGFAESLKKQRARFSNLTAEQWWLIEQVAETLVPGSVSQQKRESIYSRLRFPWASPTIFRVDDPRWDLEGEFFTKDALCAAASMLSWILPRSRYINPRTFADYLEKEGVVDFWQGMTDYAKSHGFSLARTCYGVSEEYPMEPFATVQNHLANSIFPAIIECQNAQDHRLCMVAIVLDEDRNVFALDPTLDGDKLKGRVFLDDEGGQLSQKKLCSDVIYELTTSIQIAHILKDDASQ